MMLFPIFIIGVNVLGIVAVFLAVTYMMHRSDSGLPHVPSHICQDLLTSLRNTPEQWSKVTHNPKELANYSANFYTILHESGCQLWVSNGVGSLYIYRPHEMFIPLHYKIRMWYYFKRNKSRMKWTCITILVEKTFSWLYD
jgi:hypothetical protein